MSSITLNNITLSLLPIVSNIIYILQSTIRILSTIYIQHNSTILHPIITVELDDDDAELIMDNHSRAHIRGHTNTVCPFKLCLAFAITISIFVTKVVIFLRFKDPQKRQKGPKTLMFRKECVWRDAQRDRERM